MASGKFVSYLRVSTRKQEVSGLGLEAQREAVERYLNGGKWELLAEFVEVESGSKSDRQRPVLAQALAECRLTGATLLIARLDRLARNAAFLLGLQEAGVEFVAVDMPAANRLTIGIMALVAEEERRAISARTKAALAAAKARGTKLGGDRGQTISSDVRKKALAARQAKADQFAERVQAAIQAARDAGALSLQSIAEHLNRRGIAPRRGGQWSAVQVQRVMNRGPLKKEFANSLNRLDDG